MVFRQSWTVLNPNNKTALPPEAGEAIADPWLVVRGMIQTENDNDAIITAMTPPISGRLERIVVIPDHLFQPGSAIPAGAFNIAIFQEYSERDLADGGEYADPLELLDGLGVAILNTVVTHLHAMNIAGTRTPILPQVLVQDRLRFNITDWSDGITVLPFRRAYIYLYFSGFSPALI